MHMQSPVEVAPGFSPAVTYSVRTVSDPQMVLTGNCNATLCQYLTNFTSDNPPSNNFTVTITVSNGIGGGQSVITSSQREFHIVHSCSLTTDYFFAVPFNIILSSLVTLTVVVIDSNANVTANLSSGFRGSTGLTVTYGITPNCDANTVMSANNGMAGDTLEIILSSLQPNLTYCYSIYLTQGELLFKMVGVFRSGYFVIPPDNPSLVIVVIIICAVVLSFATGIIVGILLTRFCGIGVQEIRQSKSIVSACIYMNLYTHCRKLWHFTVGHSSYNRVWPWNWYSHWLLLCEEQERYVVYTDTIACLHS